ncbi:ecotin [Commensalibacter oyaizuii]|uniref:Ecotin family protein n=1 Tax=Commensalibacter oyaizuii TaxID=3043873 RepID=A0ABT6PYI4_9PROT|nr:ecotin family protein [Commensalibacter sp. TBRC 16381]MDI2089785.1 ecotin family protein [Commensalibacter sp. TBRC 16381]
MLLQKNHLLRIITACGAFLFTTMFIAFNAYSASKKDPLSIWPKPEQGYKRVVIDLPVLHDEDNYKIELVPQKSMQVDCNRFMVSGTMETKPLTGWGYEYYVLSSIGPAASTRMACPGSTMQSKLIPVQTRMGFIRYNSKLPIVVYVPKDITMSYRVWSANPLQQGTEK